MQKLIVEVLPSGRSYKLIRPLVHEDGGFLIRVPIGFKTDFASIPRFFWRVLPPWDKHMKAAVVHDYIYRTPTEFIFRSEADKMFLRYMKDLGIGYMKRTLMYRAVRTFGGKSYQKRMEI